VGAEAVGAARAVERCEHLGRWKAEGIGRAVQSLDEREAGFRRRCEERAEILGHDAGNVGVDHEDAARSGCLETGSHRFSLSAAGIENSLATGVASGSRSILVRRHDAGASDRDAYGKNVTEHRLREGPSHAQRGVQARLPLRPGERNHDGDHAGNYARSAPARGDTPVVRIVATQRLPGSAWGELPEVELLDSWPPNEPLTGVDVLVAVVARVGAGELGLLPDLRLIANYGVGYDTVDVAACRQRGISLTNTPGVLDAAVADLTLALILACRRHLVASDRFVREGRWQRGWAQPELLGHDLAGSTLGLVGRGRIGSEVAQRAQAFGMRVVSHHRTGGLPLDELLRASDVVSLHLPLTPETHGLVSRQRLTLIREGGTLVNTSRGAIVDEEALAEELVSGRISAGLDVFADEPHVPERLLGLPNVVLTPHVASATVETRAAMTRVLVENVLAFVRGEPLPNEVVG
jgi:glyoxylate reductase